MVRNIDCSPQVEVASQCLLSEPKTRREKPKLVLHFSPYKNLGWQSKTGKMRDLIDMGTLTYVSESSGLVVFS